MAYDPAADKFRKVECLGDRAIEYMAEDGTAPSGWLHTAKACSHTTSSMIP